MWSLRSSLVLASPELAPPFVFFAAFLGSLSFPLVRRKNRSFFLLGSSSSSLRTLQMSQSGRILSGRKDQAHSTVEKDFTLLLLGLVGNPHCCETFFTCLLVV